MIDFVLIIFYTTWTEIQCKIVFLAAVLTTSMHSTPHLIIQCRLSSTYKKVNFCHLMAATFSQENCIPCWDTRTYTFISLHLHRKVPHNYNPRSYLLICEHLFPSRTFSLDLPLLGLIIKLRPQTQNAGHLFLCKYKMCCHLAVVKLAYAHFPRSPRNPYYFYSIN